MLYNLKLLSLQKGLLKNIFYIILHTQSETTFRFIFLLQNFQD